MSDQFTLDQDGQPRLRLAAQNRRAAAPPPQPCRLRAARRCSPRHRKSPCPSRT